MQFSFKKLKKSPSFKISKELSPAFNFCFYCFLSPLRLADETTLPFPNKIQPNLPQLTFPERIYFHLILSVSHPSRKGPGTRSTFPNILILILTSTLESEITVTVVVLAAAAACQHPATFYLFPFAQNFLSNSHMYKTELTASHFGNSLHYAILLYDYLGSQEAYLSIQISV